MKKLFSMLLVLAFLCSAMPAALAADTDPPMYEQFGYENANNFIIDYCPYVEYEYGADYSTLSDFYTKHYVAIQANPETALTYMGYSDFEEVDAEIANYDWNWQSYEEFYRDAAFYMAIDDLECYIPPLSVQLNGATMSFSDAQPELAGGRAMVPFRALAEAMGYTVSYGDGETVTATDGNRTIGFTVGSLGYSVTEADGSIADPMMDVAPYIKNGRTYVPVRFFAETMGMTVAWDAYANAAVVYDADAIAAEIDKNYTAVNKWLAAQPKQDDTKAFRTAMSLALTYTELNSIDGDTTYPISGTLEILSEGESYNMTVKCDLYSIVKMMMADNDYIDEEIKQFMESIKNNLKNASLELIYDADTDALYLRCPLLVQVLSGYIVGLGGTDTGIAMPTFAENTWFQIDDAMESILGMSTFPDYSALGQFAQSATVGTYIVYMMEQTDSYDPSSVCADALEAGQMFSILFGDSNFKQNGNQYTANFDITVNYNYSGTGLEQALYAMDMSCLKGYIKLNTSTGAFSTNLECRNTTYSSYDSDVLVKITANATATSGAFTLTVHEKNVGILEMNMTISQQSGASSPAKQPPTGSTVVNLTELIEGMYSSNEPIVAPVGIGNDAA